MANDVEVRIKEIIQRTYNIKSFRLEAGGKINFKAGQFICVKLLTEKEGECRRYISISSSPTENGYLEFTKRITQSEFSKQLDKLKPGDKIRIEAPSGKFVLDEAAGRIAFLSGGIGITPIRSICKYVVDKRLKTDIVLVYANRSITDIVFREDFDAMQKQYAKLRVAHVLCEPVEGFKCTVGFINAQVIRDEVPDYALRKFYICGPPAMVEAMKKILVEELALSPGSIVTENFQGY